MDGVCCHQSQTETEMKTVWVWITHSVNNHAQSFPVNLPLPITITTTHPTLNLHVNLPTRPYLILTKTETLKYVYLCCGGERFLHKDWEYPLCDSTTWVIHIHTNTHTPTHTPHIETYNTELVPVGLKNDERCSLSSILKRATSQQLSFHGYCPCPWLCTMWVLYITTCLNYTNALGYP